MSFLFSSFKFSKNNRSRVSLLKKGNISTNFIDAYLGFPSNFSLAISSILSFPKNSKRNNNFFLLPFNIDSKSASMPSSTVLKIASFSFFSLERRSTTFSFLSTMTFLIFSISSFSLSSSSSSSSSMLRSSSSKSSILSSHSSIFSSI